MGEGKGRTFIDGSESVETLIEMVTTSENPEAILLMICMTTKMTNPATFNQFIKKLKTKDPELYSKVIPTLDNSFSQSHSSEPKRGEGCFIATATMGDYNHPIVLDLRKFRDHFMAKNLVGRGMIKAYYYSSPLFARIISKSKFLRRASFIILINPIHKLIKRKI